MTSTVYSFADGLEVEIFYLGGRLEAVSVNTGSCVTAVDFEPGQITISINENMFINLSATQGLKLVSQLMAALQGAI